MIRQKSSSFLANSALLIISCGLTGKALDFRILAHEHLKEEGC